MLPLDDVKVVDLTRYMSGPFCAMQLADLGADVTKIERVGSGDDARRLAPKVNGESYPFAMINRHKRSLALDLKDERGRDIVLDMIEQADIVVENFRPDVTTRLGLDYEAARDRNPEIIYASITGFGQTGPYRHRPGFDIMAQGLMGLLRMTGEPDGAPAKAGIAVCDIAGGITAANAILAAYIHRLKGGGGQYIDVSLTDAALAWTIWESAAYFGGGEIAKPEGSRHRRTAPYQAYRTSDGYVTVGANNPKLWEGFCRDVVGKPEWIEDPRFADLPSRMENVAELEREIEAVLTTQTTEHWIDTLDAAGVPGGPVYRYDETLQDPHILAREMVVDSEHPVLGSIKSLGMAIKYSETPLSIRRPAPVLGQHTVEVLKELGLDGAQVQELIDAGVAADGQLD